MASTSSRDAPVLVVEDDPELGSLLVRALARCGVQGELADSGATALAMAAGHSYAAVLIDQMLSGMGGLELCRRLRRAGLGAPAVVMSARSDLAGAVGPAGADGSPVKLLPLNLLLAALRSKSATSRRAGRGWGDAALARD